MLDGVTEVHGGIDGNGIQIAKQLADIASVASYSFIVSCILLLIMKYIPGLHLRVSEEAEVNGLDLDQFHDEVIGDREMAEEIKETQSRAPSIMGLSRPVSTAGESPERGAKKLGTTESVAVGV